VHKISRSIPTRLGAVCAAVLLTAGVTTTVATPSQASEPTLDDVVSVDPADWTPNVTDGHVNAMVQIGNRVIAAGSFTSVKTVSSANSTARTLFTRNGIFAFNAKTGVIDTTFTPDVGTKEVYDIADAGDGTIYIGGAFTSVNGVTMTAKVARLNATTGKVLKKFKAPKLGGGKVTDLQLANESLYIGGTFTTVATQPRTLLAALDPITGDDTASVDFAFTDTWNGGHLSVRHFDISDDGSTLVAVGNWRNVDGENRPQIMMADLTDSSATLSDWATQRFANGCLPSFDTYMRDVDIAPSGDYFAVATAGGQVGLEDGTLCDAVTRWELGETTPDQDPTWVDYTGGDTLTQVKITGSVIYIGGHLRWLNNPYDPDLAGPGAVSRDGIAAIDPRNGLPFSWNPTRRRGDGVSEFMTTKAGLWVGHDTTQVGDEIHKRIALFPSAGGTALPTENTGALANGVFLLAQSENVIGDHWLARVNVGGSAVLAADDGPDWSADTDAQPSEFRDDSSTVSDWGQATIERGADVPASTPSDIFRTARSATTLNWSIPATTGHSVTVRLYFDEFCACSTGARTFDVSIDGTEVLADYDIVADGGNSEIATMQDFTITSDGEVDVDFDDSTLGSILSGIEVIDNSVALATTDPDDSVLKRTFVGSTVSTSAAITTSGIDWDDARGAFMVDGTLYTGWSDGTLRARSFNGKKFGTASEVDLNGLTDFAAEIPTIRGMFYDASTGRLYYSLWGSDRLYYRYFEPESQVVGVFRFDGPANGNGVDWRTANGLLLDGDTLYVGSSVTGELSEVGWSGGELAGSAELTGDAVVVSGPSTAHGYDWRARGTFLYAG
jgi:hypothetical protein